MQNKNIPPKSAFTVSAGFKCLELFYRKNVDLYLCYCGIENCSNGHSFGPAVRNDYLIHYITKGKGIYQVGNKTYEVKEGEYFLICPGVTTFYQADEKEPWSYIWIGFNGMKAPVYLEYLHLAQESNLVGVCKGQSKLERYVREMLEAKELTYANELRREGLLYLFLSELSMAAEEEKVEETVPDYPYEIYVEHTLRFIEENYQKNIKVNDIADEIGLNRSYLTNSFKKMLGESVQEYLIRFRMGKAESALVNTMDTVQEIARSVGYEDALAFSKAFKKRNRCSPMEYRKRFQKNQKDLQKEYRF